MLKVSANIILKKASLHLLLVILFLVSIIDGFAQSKRSEIYKHEDGKKLNFQGFVKSLEKTLKDSTVGYGMMITKNGKPEYTSTGGWRVAPIDDPNSSGIAFDLTSRMHIASITKTITAIALVKLLDEKGIDKKEPFEKFIPSYWQVHSSLKGTSIESFLYMRTGIKADNDALTSSFDSLKTILAKGVVETDKGKFHYSNANYAILKIIVAYLSGYKEIPYLKGADRNEVGIRNIFERYINKKLFEPVGIFSVGCKSLDAYPTLMYPFPYKNELGLLTGKGGMNSIDDDLSLYVGGLGLQLSINEVNKFFNTLLSTDKVLTKTSLLHLTELQFPFSKRKGQGFTYAYAMGLWIEGVEGMDYYGGLNACVVSFPDNIVITVFVNSWNNKASLLNRKILAAYETNLN